MFVPMIWWVLMFCWKSFAWSVIPIAVRSIFLLSSVPLIFYSHRVRFHHLIYYLFWILSMLIPNGFVFKTHFFLSCSRFVQEFSKYFLNRFLLKSQNDIHLKRFWLCECNMFVTNNIDVAHTVRLAPFLFNLCYTIAHFQ